MDDLTPALLREAFDNEIASATARLEMLTESVGQFSSTREATPEALERLQLLNKRLRIVYLGF